MAQFALPGLVGYCLHQATINKRCFPRPKLFSQGAAIICAYHYAAPSSNLKHTFYAFSIYCQILPILCLSFCCEKDVKRGRVWPIFKKVI